MDWQDILDPHVAQTEARMQQHPVVLCLQDTIERDFNGQFMDGFGSLSYEAQRSMYLPPTDGVTPDREPKGADGKRPGTRESLRWRKTTRRLPKRR